MEGREADMVDLRCMCADCFLDGWIGIDRRRGLGKGSRTMGVDRRGERKRNLRSPVDPANP